MYDHVLVGLSGEFFTYLVMDMKMFVTASNHVSSMVLI